MQDLKKFTSKKCLSKHRKSLKAGAKGRCNIGAIFREICGIKINHMYINPVTAGFVKYQQEWRYFICQ
jgi:hypothetical protein